MPSVSLSAGRITACWFVLRCVERLGGQSTRADLVSFASRSSLRSGGLPVRDGIRLAIEGGLLEERQDRLRLSRLGVDALALGSEDEPTTTVRRFLVSRLLLADPPTWVVYWQGDPTALDLVLPASERKTLAESGLLPWSEVDQDFSAWAFWQALRRVPLVADTAVHRKRLGDAGEELSLAHERERLISSGHPELADQVQWVARESDAYGFDILSFVGGAESNANDRLAVEVKTTSLPRTAELHFFLTSHEWETAQRLGDRYVIHAWTAVTAGPPPTAREDGPILIAPAMVLPHLPAASACSDRCHWQSAEVYLPF